MKTLCSKLINLISLLTFLLRCGLMDEKPPYFTVTTHLHLVPSLKNAWRYTSTLPIRLHGMVLS